MGPVRLSLSTLELGPLAFTLAVRRRRRDGWNLDDGVPSSIELGDVFSALRKE